MLNDSQLFYFFGSDLATAGTSGIVDTLGFPRAAANPLRIVFALNDIPLGGTSLQFDIQTSSTIDFSAPTTAYQSPVYTTTGITEPVILEQIHPIPSLKRFSRVVVTKVGTFTSGKLSVFVTYGEHFTQRELEIEQGVA